MSSRYEKESYCKTCKWKPKGINCPECGQKMRNNRRYKHENHPERVMT